MQFCTILVFQRSRVLFTMRHRLRKSTVRMSGMLHKFALPRLLAQLVWAGHDRGTM